MKKWIPLIVVAVLFILAIYFRVYDYFTFMTLKQNHVKLLEWRDQHYFLSIVLFMCVYVISVVASIPSGFILSIVGGFLFGYFWGTVYVVISATVGATLLFLAVKTVLGEWFQQKTRGWVKRMEVGFRHDEFNYLLFLRLVPVFPFFAINIVAGLLNVKLQHYFIATLLGIIPGSFVYVLVGNGLSNVFAHNQEPNMGIIFQPSILIPIIALAIFSLMPILYRRYKQQHKNKS